MIKPVTAEHKQRIEALKADIAEQDKLKRKRSIKQSILLTIVALVVTVTLFVLSSLREGEISSLLFTIGLMVSLSALIIVPAVCCVLLAEPFYAPWIDEHKLRKKILEEEFNFTFCPNQGGPGFFRTPHKYLVQLPEGEYMEAVVAFSDAEMECVMMTKQQESVTEL